MVKLDLALKRLDAGVDLALARDNRQHRPDGLAGVRREGPLVGEPTASTAIQPTNSTATPARPKVMTRSRRRGASGATTATGAGSLGVTGSVRSVGMMRGANGRRGARSSAASTSITRAIGATPRSA